MEPKLDSFDSLEDIEKIIPSPENSSSSNNFFYIENQTKLGIMDKEIESFQNISIIKKNYENSFIQINKEKIKNIFAKNKNRIPNKKIEIAGKVNKENNFMTKKFTQLIPLNIDKYKNKNKILNNNSKYNLFFDNNINLNIHSLREKYAKIKENSKNNSIDIKKLKNIKSENNLFSVKKYIEEKYNGYNLFQNRLKNKINDNDVFSSIYNYKGFLTRNNSKNDISNNKSNINENKYNIRSMRASLNKRRKIDFDLCLNNHSYNITNNDNNFSYRNNVYLSNKINNYSKNTKDKKIYTIFGEMEMSQNNNKMNNLKLKIPKSTNFYNNNDAKKLKINLNNIRNISNNIADEYKIKTENFQKNFNYKKIIKRNYFNNRKEDNYSNKDFGKIINLNKNWRYSNNNTNFNRKNTLIKKIKITSSQYDVRNNRKTPFYYYNSSMNNSGNTENVSSNISISNQTSINNLLNSKNLFNICVNGTKKY